LRTAPSNNPTLHRQSLECNVKKRSSKELTFYFGHLTILPGGGSDPFAVGRNSGRAGPATAAWVVVPVAKYGVFSPQAEMGKKT
jgi:hypothetical protein